MRWVIAYDISDDALRTPVAERLGTTDRRVQESVFECTFDPEALPEVIEVLRRMLGGALRRMLGDDEPNIRIDRICRDCLEVAVGIGPVRGTPDEEACVIG
jgi:CRISPR-associated endonuclease Cas2